MKMTLKNKQLLVNTVVNVLLAKNKASIKLSNELNAIMTSQKFIHERCVEFDKFTWYYATPSVEADLLAAITIRLGFDEDNHKYSGTKMLRDGHIYDFLFRKNPEFFKKRSKAIENHLSDLNQNVKFDF